METVTQTHQTDFTPDYWLDAWRASMTGETETVTRGHSTVGFWDNMSRTYDRQFDEKARKQLDEVIDGLETHGVFAPGMRVLDVGCGTGRLAIALARHGAEVTAFDFSEGMLDQLRANMQGLPEKSITIVQGDWTALDLDDQGWAGAFDLAMAHMTPAIRAPEGLLKLIAASRAHCLLKTWAEKRRGSILDDIWRMFTGSEPTQRRAPMIYIFNALFAMGYFPSLDFEAVKWERDQPVEEALEQYVSYARGMFDRDEAELRDRIGAYLASIAHDGSVTEHITGRTARMIWSTS